MLKRFKAYWYDNDITIEEPGFIEALSIEHARDIIYSRYFGKEYPAKLLSLTEEK